MYEIKTLEIAGYRDEKVPNTFYQQAGEARQLAVIFPGRKYTCQMPLLYYPIRFLLAQGADVLCVDYEYGLRTDFGKLSESEQERWLLDDVTASARSALEQRAYQQITIIGKSLGTRAMGNLLANEAAFERARAIWLTPLFGMDKLRKQIKSCGQKSLFVIGTSDPHYNEKYLDDVREAMHHEVLIIDRADHCLEIEGDVLKSLQALEQVMHAIKQFLV